jgi:ATP-binding cassette, subfamily B, bacterial
MAELHYEEEEFGAKWNGTTVWRIIRLTGKHWKLLVGFLCLIATTSITESSFTYLVKLIIDRGIVAGDRAFFARAMVLYGALSALFGGLVFGFIYCAGYLGELLAYDLRKKLFAHLQQLSFSYFDRTPVGWLMSRVTSDTSRIADFATWMLLDLTWATTNIVAATVFMFIINRRLALIVAGMLPVLVVVSALFKKYIISEYRKVRSINSKITGAYNENIQGVRVVKALVRERRNLGAFGDLTGTMFHTSYRAAWLSALFLPMVQIASALAVGAVLWFGGRQARVGALTIGGIQAFVGYITFMLWPIENLARVYAEMQHAIASAERVFSLLDTEAEIRNQRGAVPIRGDLEGRIVFDRVTFYYEPDNPVLSDFSLEVEPGQTIALVGPTGGGKTTIVNLACRFYEPKEGRILIDGRDYREYTLESLQSRLGVVLQTPHLFSGTIEENIRYGRLDATREEIEAAARAARAHEFIRDLEHGYEEEVGEGGALLSVGQKQLVSLARAILAGPQIIIMDEATSSIDTITEGLIQRGIEELLADSTAFVIAHRLSTIRSADRIVVIDKGRIVESGTHAALIAHGGHYYELYTRQFRSEHTANLGALA